MFTRLHKYTSVFAANVYPTPQICVCVCCKCIPDPTNMCLCLLQMHSNCRTMSTFAANLDRKTMPVLAADLDYRDMCVCSYCKLHTRLGPGMCVCVGCRLESCTAEPQPCVRVGCTATLPFTLCTCIVDVPPECNLPLQ